MLLISAEWVTRMHFSYIAFQPKWGDRTPAENQKMRSRDFRARHVQLRPPNFLRWNNSNRSDETSYVSLWKTLVAELMTSVLYPVCTVLIHVTRALCSLYPLFTVSTHSRAPPVQWSHKANSDRENWALNQNCSFIWCIMHMTEVIKILCIFFWK